VSACPYCGLPPTATTENDDSDLGEYECENGHTWPADEPP
jgi:hypothetical protein